jgi:hypothetical protein
MTQYHAIGLLYQMRSGDRMSLVKMVQQYSAAGVVKSPAATVLLVRLAAKLAEEDPNLRKVNLSRFIGKDLLTPIAAHDATSRRLVAPQVGNGQLRSCKGHLRHARCHRCRTRTSRSRPPALPHVPSLRHQVCRPSHLVANGFLQAGCCPIMQPRHRIAHHKLEPQYRNFRHYYTPQDGQRVFS